MAKRTTSGGAKRAAASSRPASRSTRRTRGAARNAFRVRMYRQGLGDCFLLTLPGEKGRPYRIMIDCGVIIGTENPRAIMSEVVKSIIKETGGKVDLLVVTHEHWDHISGFVQVGDLFAPAGAKGSKAGKLRVGEVWFAWTEDPEDKLATRLRKERAERVAKLKAFLGAVEDARLKASTGPVGSEALRFGAASEPIINGVGEVLGFFGIDPPALGTSKAGKGAKKAASASKAGAGTTADAMSFARSLSSKVRYRRASDRPELIPGGKVRAYVLGPPPDEKMIRKTDSKVEVYREFADGVANAFLAAAMSEQALASAVDGEAYDELKEGIEASQPFDRVYRKALAPPASAGGAADEEGTTDPLVEFLDRHYFGRTPDEPLLDQSWRRIDGDWLYAAAQFALQLDSYTNNTSLALAFEIVKSNKVLLFVADAQVGNWLSWQDLEWVGSDGIVKGTDLLNRAVFYKVGHHGSHNATLREKGLEMMTSGDLVAFIPVHEGMAKKKNWNHMPLPGLVRELERRTHGRVVRIDEHYDAKSAAGGSKLRKPSGEVAKKFFSGLRKDRLFYEWSLPLD